MIRETLEEMNMKLIKLERRILDLEDRFEFLEESSIPKVLPLPKKEFTKAEKVKALMKENGITVIETNLPEEQEEE